MKDVRRILPGEIPEEGERLSGRIESDIFQLPDRYPKPDGPVEFDLVVTRYGELVIAMGSLAVTFLLECVRCLEAFPYRIELRGHTVEVILESEAPIDLAEHIREDLLLALPTYPKCESSSLGARTCSPEVTIINASEAAARIKETAKERRNVWGALDNLKTLDDNR
jgi:uncharacterized protein